MRKWIIAGCAAAMVLAIAGAIIFVMAAAHATCPVNEANAARVALGMTEAEVTALLGGPPGDYRVRSRAVTFEVGLAPLPGNVLKQWRGDDGLALIQFGADGRVIDAQFLLAPRFDESLLDRVLGLLGL